MKQLTPFVCVVILACGLCCSDDTNEAVDAAPADDGNPARDSGVDNDAAREADGGRDGDGSSDGDSGDTISDAASDLGQDAAEKCVPESFTLATVGPSGGSQCSFPFDKPFTPGEINLLLTPGWGTICYAGSSSNCGSGASTDGWWFSGGKILLCDATCIRFYEQTIAGKLTVRLSCPTEDCKH